MNLRIVMCVLCGHQWPSELERPTRCPKCRKANWDTGYKRRVGRPPKYTTDEERREALKLRNREYQRRFQAKRKAL